MVAQPSTGERAAVGINFSLYLITDRCQANGRPLLDVVRAALLGGVKAVQLREKGLADAELLELALSMRVLTAEFGALLIINKRSDICLAVGADGIHLGVDGLSVREARNLYGDKLLIGYSAHGFSEAVSAEKDGADFITFGPVYQTPSKLSYGDPLGLTALKSVCSTLQVPVFALGGVKLINVPEVMAAGATGIAMISAIIAAKNPEIESVSLLKMIEEHANNS